MITTGTDIKPLEIVFFMRSVASKNFFEQMKGRSLRVVSDTYLQSVSGEGARTNFACGQPLIHNFAPVGNVDGSQTLN